MEVWVVTLFDGFPSFLLCLGLISLCYLAKQDIRFTFLLLYFTFMFYVFPYSTWIRLMPIKALP